MLDTERHGLDRVSLMAGLLFVIVAVLGLSDQLAELDPDLLNWLLPAALVVVGLVVLGQGIRGRGPPDDDSDG